MKLSRSRFVLFSSLWTLASSAMAQTRPLRLEHLLTSSGVLASRALEENRDRVVLPVYPLMEG